MASNSQKLNQYKQELSDIIKELQIIEDEIRTGFKNVGNKECANCIHRVVELYKVDLAALEKIKPSQLDKKKESK